MDARVNTADDISASDKSLMNFGPVASEFCGCVCTVRAHAWLCHAYRRN